MFYDNKEVIRSRKQHYPQWM